MTNDFAKELTKLSPQRLSLLCIELQAELDATRRARKEPIAIVGMACRFPGGADVERFWESLANAVDTTREVPANRWDIDAYYDPDPDAPGKMYVRRGAFIDAEVAQFDAQFFGIAPREVVSMDPQQRLLLEVSWEALEHAGIVPGKLAGTRAGVFMGLSTNDYGRLMVQRGTQAIDAYGTGLSHSIACGRLSYFLGLQGPSVALDTACSSSLVTVHLASQSLRNNECRVALAGGVNLILSPETTINLSKARMLSPEGKCKTFDAAADGFVRGEGCGVVVLKRLSDAIADGDNIVALIRGSAVNHDGRSSGLTVPNGPSQQVLIREALSRAGLEPKQVSYIEAHGTGTSLGDPIEVRALAGVFGQERSAASPLLLGSVKTNIGHLEAAAGVAGLIKTVLMLQHGEIAPHLNFKEPSPHIAWQELPVRVATARTSWAGIDGRRIAGISSFGLSGTNAHVIVEEAPLAASSKAEVERGVEVLALSAKTEGALQEMSARLAQYVRGHEAVGLSDVCYSANNGRSHFGQRVVFVSRTREQLLNQLEGESAEGVVRGRVGQRAPKVAFLFSGQGSQYVGMGQQLLRVGGVYREVLLECEELLRPYLDQPLLKVLSGEAGAELLLQTQYTQPALFAVEYALARQWQSWGVEPALLLGHSIGEYVAACVAGAFTLAAGLKLVAARGRLMQERCERGAMLAVNASEARVRAELAALEEEVWIAALNGPEQVVLSGQREVMERVQPRLEARGLRVKRLAVEQGFHSGLMEPMLEEFAAVAREIKYAPLERAVVSNVSGEVKAVGERLESEYWLRQVRETVRFSEGMKRLRSHGCDVYVEVGPQAQLVWLGQQCLGADEVEWCWSLRAGRDEWEQMLESVGKLYVRGVEVKWEAVSGGAGRRKVALPSYPFQRQRYWFSNSAKPSNNGSSPAPKAKTTTLDHHPLLGQRLRLALKDTLFESYFDVESMPFLNDHRLHGELVVSGTCYLSLALAAANEVFGKETPVVEDVDFLQFLIPEEDRPVQFVVSSTDKKSGAFSVYSLRTSDPEEAAPTLHAQGRLRVEPIANSRAAVSREQLQANCEQQIAGADFYQDAYRLGVQLGNNYQWIKHIWRRDGDVLAQLQTPSAADNLRTLHPGLLDSCFQLLGPALSAERRISFEAGDTIYIPVKVEQLRYFNRTSSQMWCRVQLSDEAKHGLVCADLILFDDDDQLIAEVTGLYLKQLRRETFQSLVDRSIKLLYEVEWQPNPHKETATQEPETLLIFAERADGISNALVQLMEERGKHSIRVFPGDNFARVDDGYTLNPLAAEDWQQLLEECPADSFGVVHLGAVSSKELSARDQELGLGSLLHLTQALARRGANKSTRLWVVTQGAQRVGEEKIAVVPTQSMMWGLGRVVAVEHPEFWGGLIDIEPEATEHDSAALLLAELSHAEEENQIAFRGGQRLTARLQAGSPKRFPTGAVNVRSDASYLITGGKSGLGLLVAQWLVQRGARHLVLLGRRPASAAALQSIEQLRVKGATVTLVEADVADRASLERVLRELRQPLRGVVHAAGVLEDGVLLQQSWDQFTRVLRAKAEGAWHLHHLTLDEQLDFFVLFSSAAALLGSPGQSNYAGANAFLDGLAQQRRAAGLPGLSINWGAWSGTGMTSALDDRLKRRLAAQGMGNIEPEQGKVLLERVMLSNAAQVAVLPVTWPTFFDQFASGKIPRFFDHIAHEINHNGHARKSTALLQLLQDTPSEARQALLVSHIQTEVAAVMGLEADQMPGPQQGLFEMGLDSLMTVDLKNRLQSSLGYTFPVTATFNYPTIEALAGFLLKDVLAFETEVKETPETEHVLSDEEAAVAEIENLSDEELDAMLMEIADKQLL